jgi:hypothetical protein
MVWSEDSSFSLFPIPGRVYVWKPNIGNVRFGSKGETRVGFCDGLRSNIVVQHSADPIITLLGRITTTEYVDRLGNLVYPIIETLLPNNNAVFQDDSSPIHTAGTVQSWLESR